MMSHAFVTVPLDQRQLFLDDEGVAQVRGLTRTMHRPAKKGAVIRPDLAMGIECPQVRSAPVWDASLGVYRLWDTGGTPAPLRERGIACSGQHHSRDGLHWWQPRLGQIELGGTRDNHLASVVIEGRHRSLDSVIGAAGRGVGFYALSYVDATLRPSYSADGVRWAPLDVPPLPSSDEFNLSYDAAERRYLATVKLDDGPHGRSVALATSADFHRWEHHGLMFHADEEDQRRAAHHVEARLSDPRFARHFYHDPGAYNVDVYNMGVFRYEGLYLGLPAMYHAIGRIDNYPNTDGFQVVQLACSRDLRLWSRLGDREPFLAPSPTEAGAYDLTQVLPPSCPVVRGDELWFYYSGIRHRAAMRYEGTYPHGRHVPFPGVDRDGGAICLAVLRRDGFMSLDAGDAPCELRTKGFALPGPRLHVNADAAEGEVTVEALDPAGETRARSAAIRGDQPAAGVEWLDDAFAPLRGQLVSLRFTLRNARLYSWWIEE